MASSSSSGEDMRMQTIIDTNAAPRPAEQRDARRLIVRKVRNDEMSVSDAIIVLNALGVQRPEEEMPLEPDAMDLDKLTIAKKRTRS